MMIVLESNAVAPTPLKDGLKGSSAAASKKTTATLILEGGSWMSHKHTQLLYVKITKSHKKNCANFFIDFPSVFLLSNVYAKCKCFFFGCLKGKKCQTSQMALQKNIDREMQDSKMIQNDSKGIQYV